MEWIGKISDKKYNYVILSRVSGEIERGSFSEIKFKNEVLKSNNLKLFRTNTDVPNQKIYDFKILDNDELMLLVFEMEKEMI